MNNNVGDRRGERMKVFGVGFQRTGTTSLAVALNTLGIKTLQFPKELYHDIDHDVIREFVAESAGARKAFLPFQA